MIYRLNEAIERKEVGVYPQHANTVRQGDILIGVTRDYKIPLQNEKVVVPHIELRDKAIRTDLLSAGSDSIKKTVSSKFYQFLKPYLQSHKTWSIDITNDSHVFDIKSGTFILKKEAKIEYYDYSLLHILNPEEGFISYKKSEFFLDDKNNYFNNIGINGVNESYIENPKHQVIQLDSKESYYKLYEELKKDKTHHKVIIARKIMFCLKNIKPQCVFRISTPINNLSGYYVTQKLMDKILEQNFTGMIFTQLKDLNKHVEIAFS